MKFYVQLLLKCKNFGAVTLRCTKDIRYRIFYQESIKIISALRSFKEGRRRTIMLGHVIMSKCISSLE